eukprot:205819-Amorphochlora_amoeboformis.AAC.1
MPQRRSQQTLAVLKLFETQDGSGRYKTHNIYNTIVAVANIVARQIIFFMRLQHFQQLETDAHPVASTAWRSRT